MIASREVMIIGDVALGTNLQKILGSVLRLPSVMMLGLGRC